MSSSTSLVQWPESSLSSLDIMRFCRFRSSCRFVVVVIVVFDIRGSLLRRHGFPTLLAHTGCLLSSTLLRSVVVAHHRYCFCNDARVLDVAAFRDVSSFLSLSSLPLVSMSQSLSMLYAFHCLSHRCGCRRFGYCQCHNALLLSFLLPQFHSCPLLVPPSP